MSNCHVSLGDRIWRQIFRIPMGFACSPLWCNIYFFLYECQFIMKLAKLGEQTLWTDSDMQQDTWMTYVGLMWGIQIYFSTHIILGQRTIVPKGMST